MSLFPYVFGVWAVWSACALAPADLTRARTSSAQPSRAYQSTAHTAGVRACAAQRRLIANSLAFARAGRALSRLPVFFNF